MFLCLSTRHESQCQSALDGPCFLPGSTLCPEHTAAFESWVTPAVTRSPPAVAALLFIPKDPHVPTNGSSSPLRPHHRRSRAPKYVSVPAMTLPAWAAWSCTLLAFLAVGLAGCGSSEDAHEDEHLEHFVPAHKPNNFSELVEQLALRAPQLTGPSQPTGGTGESQPAAVREFSDIIGWIPELAADSELKRAEFDAAVASGNRLA